MPLILRDIPDSDLRDAVSPYGYSGPVSDASHEDTAFWRRACDQMIETLGANGMVTTFVRLHPLLPVPLDVLERSGAVVHHGETVSVDLTLSLEEMWHETRRDHRNHINRARRAGGRGGVRRLGAARRVGRRLPREHARLGASRYYFFTREHLAALHEAVGDRMHLAVALVDGEVVGGNTFFEYDGIATGYVVLDPAGPKAGTPTSCSTTRCGGGQGPRRHASSTSAAARAVRNDSLFSYKAGFSPVPAPVPHLAGGGRPGGVRGCWRGRGPDADPADLSATFPPYR